MSFSRSRSAFETSVFSHMLTTEKQPCPTVSLRPTKSFLINSLAHCATWTLVPTSNLDRSRWKPPLFPSSTAIKNPLLRRNQR